MPFDTTAEHHLESALVNGNYWDYCSTHIMGNCDWNGTEVPNLILAAIRERYTKPALDMEEFVKKVTKVPDPRPRATHRLCGGCGELFQPKTLGALECSAECAPLRKKEQDKLRKHAEKAARGLFD